MRSIADLIHWASAAESEVLPPWLWEEHMPSDSMDSRGERNWDDSVEGVEFLLFDSLVHHLIEKGLLTKNDALSVVQTAAQVVRGRLNGGSETRRAKATLTTLERTYSSFEALPERQGSTRLDGHNVHPLRTPLHGDRPQFPADADD